MLALVSARTELRRAGVNSYFGVCPFHDERTGSFHVRPEESLYHCFGCQASGDAFKFVMETEGLDFTARAGVAGRALRGRARDRGRGSGGGLAPPAARAPVVAARARGGVLRPVPVGGRRGRAGARVSAGARLREETLREFRRRLRPQRLGPDAARLASGRVHRRRAARGRARAALAVAPGTDLRPLPRADHVPVGRARGGAWSASGRARCARTSAPKYLNTSDGELYHKREQLFGIDLARSAAARAGRMVLVRGLHRRARAAPGRALATRSGSWARR